MKHARADYDRIQDPDGSIPQDEPVFILRGQDVCAPAAVLKWADCVELLGGDKELVALARVQAQRMREWQLYNRCKIPDGQQK